MLTDEPLNALLEELAAPRAVPGGGSALAAALAVAAAVVQMAARLSAESWPDAAGVAAQAESLRERAAALVDEDAEAFRRALEAQKTSPDADPSAERRDFVLGQALAAAAEPPLQLARLAADVAELSAAVAERGEPRVHADAVAAAALAAGVAHGARELVAVNLTAAPGDPRVQEAARLADAAAAVTARLRLQD